MRLASLGAAGADSLVNFFSLPSFVSTGCPEKLIHPTSTIHSLAFSQPKVPSSKDNCGGYYCAIASEGQAVDLMEVSERSGAEWSGAEWSGAEWSGAGGVVEDENEYETPLN